MDLIWPGAVIAGLMALAGCVAAAVLRPTASSRLRPLANVGRLTRIPEYLRAARLRTLSAVAAIILLGVIFAAAVLVAGRPTGLPTATGQSGSGQPEDIMVCVGGPVTEPAVGEVLQFFADQVRTFGTQRVGLSSANRRVVPLTRDYQYAAAQFAEYAAPEGQQEQAGVAAFAPTVSYADYAGNIEDVLAMCLTGFPSFRETTAQRRSLIYVGPESLRRPDGGAQLFNAAAVGDLAKTAGVQINVLVTGADGQSLAALAHDNGGLSFSATADVATQLAEIRNHPPAASAGEAAATKAVESPDLPLVVALLALAALALWPLVVRA